MKKKVLAALLSTAMVATLLTGCGSKEAPATEAPAAEETPAAENGEPEAETPAAEAGDDGSYTIAWVDGNLANESNAVCTTVAKEYAESLGINFLLLDGEGVGENQVSQCETLVAQGVDCIIIQPYDAAACQVAAESTIEAGVPVLVTKGEIADQSVCPFVGQDDFIAGQMEMEWMAEKLGGKGNIVILEGPTGISAELKRNDGINDVLKNYPDIKVIYTQPANWNRDEGMNLMETWLQTPEGEQINAVVAHNDEMALGAYDAIADAGKAGEIFVIGIDAIDAAKASVEAGEMDATVLQDVESIAKKTIDVALMMAKGEEVDDVYNIDPILLTSENIADYMN